jgi:hypothetical protein
LSRLWCDWWRSLWLQVAEKLRREAESDSD